MREVGQRRQSLAIRLTLLEPIADLLDHLIRRVQSQMWQLLFAQFLAIDVPLGSVLDCLLKRAEPAGARRGKPRGIFRAHSYGPEPEVHASLAGNRRIVAQYICGHRTRHIMRTYLAVSKGETGREMRTPTLYTPKGPSSKTPIWQHRRQRRQPDGAEERSRPQTRAWSAGRAGGHSRSGRKHPARQAIRGRACPCTSSLACEVLTRGELTRLQAALATFNQMSLPFD
jgi:hypothetical protein